MKIFHDFSEIKDIKNPVLTIGTFDGVHLGHQKILKRLKEEAEKIGGETVLFTFYPHPRMVLFPDSHGLKLLQLQEEKIEKLKRLGLDNLIIQPFTKDFSDLSAQEFVEEFLVDKLKVSKLVIGYDHQFGKDRQGSSEFLKCYADKYNYSVIDIPAQEIDEVNISSTKIRKAIEAGDIQTANAYLGDPVEIRGIVVHGEKNGRKFGFPTANLRIESDLKILPGVGVYVVNILLENGILKHGMMNIGLRPTVVDKSQLSIEVNLFDFNSDIYGQTLIVQVLDRIRSEIKFESIEKLIQQIQQDEIQCRKIHSSLLLLDK
jgi:riboflavin kinase / FMN adenylyltransferase